MKSTWKTTISVIAITVLLALTGCKSATNETKKIQTNDTAQTINEVKAKRIALDTLNGGIVKNIHMEESKEGSKEYEVTIVKRDQRFEVDVDALTGKVSEISKYSPNDNKMKNVSPKVSMEKAKAIAMDKVNGRGTITEITLDTFHNQLVYDVEIASIYGYESEVIVDATSGKVLQFTKHD